MHPLTATLIALGVSGALGGILAGITRRTSHKARLPFTGRLVELGFFGDGLVGSGASVATHFLAAPLLQLGSTENSALDHWIQLISISVLAGFLGAKLLTSRTAHLVERLAAAEDQIDRLERRERIHEILRRADALVTDHRPEHALVTYREVLRIDPGSETAQLGIAKVLFDRCKWDDAIRTLSRLLETHPSSAPAIYNLACYKSASGKYRKEEILQDLKSAVALDPMYRTYAALQEKAFEQLRDDEEFQRVVS